VIAPTLVLHHYDDRAALLAQGWRLAAIGVAVKNVMAVDKGVAMRSRAGSLSSSEVSDAIELRSWLSTSTR
jgi:hypothetical protein